MLLIRACRRIGIAAWPYRKVFLTTIFLFLNAVIEIRYARQFRRHGTAKIPLQTMEYPPSKEEEQPFASTGLFYPCYSPPDIYKHTTNSRNVFDSLRGASESAARLDHSCAPILPRPPPQSERQLSAGPPQPIGSPAGDSAASLTPSAPVLLPSRAAAWSSAAAAAAAAAALVAPAPEPLAPDVADPLDVDPFRGDWPHW
jgi:hypothetical protein